MMQDGEALDAMKLNAAQHPGAAVSVVSDDVYVSMLAAQPKTVEELNAPIKAQIAILDLKRIRPLAEGDTGYLAQINDQIKALRAKLQ